MSKKNILVIGDSHAWDIYYSLSKISRINNKSNFQFYNMGTTCRVHHEGPVKTFQRVGDEIRSISQGGDREISRHHASALMCGCVMCRRKRYQSNPLKIVPYLR